MELYAVAAVVTGGASGLGRATAEALAKAGAKVAIFDMNREAGEAVAHAIGGVFCAVNVADDASVEAGFRAARSAHEQERVLVNCAGAANAIKTAGRDRKTGAISSFPLADFERIIQINLIGTLRCVAKSAAGMLAIDPLDSGERGVIVNTASIAAVEGQTGRAAYSASKGGSVNAILPGMFDTPLMNGSAEVVKDALAASVPFPKRFGQPHEFASLAVEMCRNTYFNGETVRLDGGVRMGFP
jgi:NAD(P)-dependent dehydrogenase (short-subunit alcohol dehydrogenase family)